MLLYGLFAIDHRQSKLRNLSKASIDGINGNPIMRVEIVKGYRKKIVYIQIGNSNYDNQSRRATCFENPSAQLITSPNNRHSINIAQMNDSICSFSEEFSSKEANSKMSIAGKTTPLRKKSGLLSSLYHKLKF